MKLELERTLFEKYPKIFKQKDLAVTETAMCWGINTGDGWYWLIDQLCRQLQWDIDKNGAPQLEATQVKQKYGSLRFYTDAVTDQQDGAIELAGAMSYTICEECGSTKDVTQTTGYIISLCSKCKKEYLNERKETKPVSSSDV